MVGAGTSHAGILLFETKGRRRSRTIVVAIAFHADVLGTTDQSLVAVHRCLTLHALKLVVAIPVVAILVFCTTIDTLSGGLVTDLISLRTILVQRTALGTIDIVRAVGVGPHIGFRNIAYFVFIFRGRIDLASRAPAEGSGDRHGHHQRQHLSGLATFSKFPIHSQAPTTNSTGEVVADHESLYPN